MEAGDPFTAVTARSSVVRSEAGRPENSTFNPLRIITSTLHTFASTF